MLRLRELLLERLFDQKAEGLSLRVLQEEYYLEMRPGCFQAIWLKIDSLEEELGKEGKNIVMERSGRLLESCLKHKCFDMLCREQGHGNYIGILNYAEGKQEEIRRILKDCLNQLESGKKLYGEICFSLAAGSVVKEPAGMPKSLREASLIIEERLVKGTGRRMWFLNDPIEDHAGYTWENYRYNYIKTATASLLHPYIWHYEICPWPHRVFEEKYPRPAEKTAACGKAEEPRTIPQAYATLLSGMFQMFGDMEQTDISFEGAVAGVGIFMSDSGLFQRTFPDGIVAGKTIGKWLGNAMRKGSGSPADEERAERLAEEIESDESMMKDFIQSQALPQFFGMALPLVKYGLPVRPVQLDNVRRFAVYLEDSRFLILSYEYIKPEAPDVNASLVSWVRKGGSLLYIGDGSDPFHGISAWWRQSGYENPAQHLFELADMERKPGDGCYPVGKGRIIVWNMLPARLCLKKAYAQEYRELVRRSLGECGLEWRYRNDLTLHRGPYIISAVMDESVNDAPRRFDGLYADMLENDYRILTYKEIKPDENAILFDFSKIGRETFRIIGTSARVEEADILENKIRFRLKTADNIRAFLRVRLSDPAEGGTAMDEEGNEVNLSMEWEERSRTLLLSYDSCGKAVNVELGLR